MKPQLYKLLDKIIPFQ